MSEFVAIADCETNDAHGTSRATLCAQLTSPETMDAAFDWLCARRRDWPDHADVWAFRRNWQHEKRLIQRQIRAGIYRFSLQTRVTTSSASVAHIWSARDALVLKALTLVLFDVLPASRRCTHLKGHGGLKDAVRQAASNIQQHNFAFRTDVKSYYDSIDHGLLIERLKRHIRDERVLGLIRQYLGRTSESGGIFYEFNQGISAGCSLSPLIGAFFLNDLDNRMEQQAVREGLFYVRYMDDILLFAPSRWKLRRAVNSVNEELAVLGLEQHPDKTFIGYIARGFDFLGYRFGSNGLVGLAHQTIVNFEAKLTRLYEQRCDGSEKRIAMLERDIKKYITRFSGWVYGGLTDVQNTFTSAPVCGTRGVLLRFA